jgi:RNA polymerase sigma factor (sigma-70 family)
MPLASTMAKRVTSLPFEDAAQGSTIGLLRAADRFDDSRNTAFSTCARYWITEALQKAAIQSLPVHVPLHVAKASLAKTRRDERAANDSPADGERPRHLRRTGDRRIDHAFAETNIRAVRAEMESEEGNPLHGDALTQNPWTALDIRMDAGRVVTLFAGLTDRQKNALMLHFGIGGHDGYTLEEAGNVMGISREAVRQLILRGLEELRGFLRET